MSLEAFIVIGLGVFIIAFMKGAFGGGFAVIGIPFLSLAMSPLEAGVLLAPLFIFMDACALYYWRPQTWSGMDLIRLLPAQLLGIGAGYLFIEMVNARLVAIAIAGITLAFAAHWWFTRSSAEQIGISTRLAPVAGFASGLTTMIAHSGGPPLAVYLLRRNLGNALYAGTTSIFFTVGNAVKLVPWLYVGQHEQVSMDRFLVGAAFVPVGVVVGWLAHSRLDQKQLTQLLYLLLVFVSLKMLWSALV
jgi:uncharacterized membrane protein YfcA